MNIEDVLMKCELFEGLSALEIEKVLPCLGARKQLCIKGSYPIKTGDHLPEVGVLIAGELEMIKEDFQGNTTIIQTIKPSDLFGVSIVCFNTVESPIAVRAREDSYVLFMHLTRLMHSCGNACQHHGRVVANLIGMLAGENLTLQSKIDILSKRTTREKLLTYLEYLHSQQRRNPVVLPLKRGEIADFISVDRSAMSRELSKLRREGYIKIDRNEVELLKTS